MAPAAIQVEGDVLPAPCSIHDDRLRELETEQAAQVAQLRAGSQMFEGIQESIRMLSSHVSDSMGRVEDTVNRVADDVRVLASQVGELRVKQTEHDGKIADLTAKKVKEEEDAEDRKKTVRDYVIKGTFAAGALGISALAGAHGKEWLSSFFRAIAGG